MNRNFKKSAATGQKNNPRTNVRGLQVDLKKRVQPAPNSDPAIVFKRACACLERLVKIIETW
jgi:hypothetical protein